MCLLERNSVSKNWIKSADKITENPQGFGVILFFFYRVYESSLFRSSTTQTFFCEGARLSVIMKGKNGKRGTVMKVVFVCLGNICRSPMAEAVFRKMVHEEGM